MLTARVNISSPVKMKLLKDVNIRAEVTSNDKRTNTQITSLICENLEKLTLKHAIKSDKELK